MADLVSLRLLMTFNSFNVLCVCVCVHVYGCFILCGYVYV